MRDRGDGAIRFTSAILPRYLRRAKSLEDLLPWLYLKGISTGDFGEALAALLGSSAPGLSASTITRLKEVWGVEAERNGATSRPALRFTEEEEKQSLVDGRSAKNKPRCTATRWRPLGWKALRQVYPGAREQRCWVHKTGNLNKLPKGLQKKAKGRLHWMAEPGVPSLEALTTRPRPAWPRTATS